MRFACDTGGTFTDLLVEAGDDLRMYKAHTVPGDPARGVLDALSLAAADRGLDLSSLLARGDTFVHGTTHAINAIITGRTARTAFLTTEGHPDTLVLREGGRTGPFDHSVEYPEPYIPRALTFEIVERVDPSGRVTRALDEVSVLAAIDELRAEKVESVAVCLLWSIVNPAHEIRIGELLTHHLPDVPFSLSHALNPTIREYRRASATAIDASLKPLMTRYLGGIEARMREAGFTGRVLVLTSQGGTMEAADLARAPIHAINSGPSMAPIAGKYFAALEGPQANGEMRDIIVADTGGTTYDVSLVRGGLIPTSRETWIGTPYRGHMTGFPSVDVKSVGAGGGSIAWVDAGGVLHVGPQSAGSVPGPVCYAKGGTEPTVTDACVALGYIDPDYFLGGSIALDREAARKAIETRIGDRLGLDVERAASSILELVTENMVQAIADITVNQGIDAAESVLIGGGGAAGLNSVWIGRRLGCREVNFPEVGAALSAGGALLSDLTAEFRAAFVATSERFDFGAANAVLASLTAQCGAYAADAGKGALATEISFAFEARYPSQVWDLEVPLPRDRIEPSDLGAMVAAFHGEHRRVFAIDDPDSGIELTGLIARIRCRLRESGLSRLAASSNSSSSARHRRAYFAGHGWADTVVHRISELTPGLAQAGPALIESPFTTIVVDPAARFRVTASGGVVVTP